MEFKSVLELTPIAVVWPSSPTAWSIPSSFREHATRSASHDKMT